jgi:phosphohistidine phosphatase
MKNLILIRHAKSNWDAPLQDLDRPLDQRGMKDAHLVSSRILDFIPKTYVCHPSANLLIISHVLIITYF